MRVWDVIEPGGMLVIAAALRQWLGDAGVKLGAAGAGFVGTHATAVSGGALAAPAKLKPQEAVRPILAAMTSNTLAKIATASGTGSRAFAQRMIPGLLAPLAAARAVAALTALR